MNSVILSLFQYWRHRSTLCVTKGFFFLNLITFIFSLAFIAEDEYMAGLTILIKAPNQLGVMVFLLLTLYLKQYVRMFYSLLSPKNKKHVERYQTIEDRLYMEEYEDPEQ